MFLYLIIAQDRISRVVVTLCTIFSIRMAVALVDKKPNFLWIMMLKKWTYLVIALVTLIEINKCTQFKRIPLNDINLYLSKMLQKWMKCTELLLIITMIQITIFTKGKKKQT